jgi:hypothetical protein
VLCEPDIGGPEPLAQLGQAGRQFDVCIANILRGPLVELQPRLSGYVKPGGQLVLSGILREQVPEIREAYGEAGWLTSWVGWAGCQGAGDAAACLRQLPSAHLPPWP